MLALFIITYISRSIIFLIIPYGISCLFCCTAVACMCCSCSIFRDNFIMVLYLSVILLIIGFVISYFLCLFAFFGFVILVQYFHSGRYWFWMLYGLSILFQRTWFIWTLAILLDLGFILLYHYSLIYSLLSRSIFDPENISIFLIIEIISMKKAYKLWCPCKGIALTSQIFIRNM